MIKSRKINRKIHIGIGGNHMEIIKNYMTTANLKKSVRALDSFALRYIPMFFIIAIANGLVLKILFNKEVNSRFTLITLILTTLFVCVLWVNLDRKVNFSVFDRTLPSHIKKKELKRRGVCIVIFYLLLQGIRSLEGSNHLVQVIAKKILELSFAITILILISTFIIITLRPAAKRKNKRKR